MKDDGLYRLIILFFGSWWSIIGHTMLFVGILLLTHDLLFFTMFLSIEAILIGILILMATNREQALIDRRTAERRIRDRELVREDVNITNHVMEEMRLLKKHQQDTAKSLEEIKHLITKTTTTP